ncbi:hypothetical protein AFCA_009847 [Aspergillus flavus]|nr:hypothetical protein AFCA_009847 [Aspergillus flavus]
MLVFISKQGYLDRFSSAMVAAAGGDEDFYSQIEDLKFQNGDDIEQMYKVLGG